MAMLVLDTPILADEELELFGRDYLALDAGCRRKMTFGRYCIYRALRDMNFLIGRQRVMA